MPKETRTLNIPNGGNISMNQNQDQLLIHVTQQNTQWCYSDPKHVFPSLLAPGTYGPGDYGPYEATGTGTVNYDDENPCHASGGVTGVPHTIIVSN